MFVYDKHLAKLQHVETLHEISALTNNSELNEHIDTIVAGLQVQYRLRCSPDPTTISASKLEKIAENELQNSLLHPVKRQKRQKLSHKYVFFHQFYHTYINHSLYIEDLIFLLHF